MRFKNGVTQNYNPKNIGYIFNAFNRILKHYQCPENCNAICCKFSTICFEADEYPKILRVIDQISREIIEKYSQPASDGYYRCLPEGICPLLSGKKCSIYENRPMVCQRYPFEITENGQIILRPCSLGIKLILDFVTWSGRREYIEVLYRNWQNNADQKVPQLAFIVDSMEDGAKMLKQFNRFLNKTTSEERKLRREELIAEIEKNYSMADYIKDVRDVIKVR